MSSARQSDFDPTLAIAFDKEEARVSAVNQRLNTSVDSVVNDFVFLVCAAVVLGLLVGCVIFGCFFRVCN